MFAPTLKSIIIISSLRQVRQLFETYACTFGKSAEASLKVFFVKEIQDPTPRFLYLVVSCTALLLEQDQA